MYYKINTKKNDYYQKKRKYNKERGKRTHVEKVVIPIQTDNKESSEVKIITESEAKDIVERRRKVMRTDERPQQQKPKYSARAIEGKDGRKYISIKPDDSRKDEGYQTAKRKPYNRKHSATAEQRKAYNENKFTKRGKIDFNKVVTREETESLDREICKFSDLVKDELASIVPKLPEESPIAVQAYPKEFNKTFKELEEAMKKEVWVSLYGFEDTHKISSMGRVRSNGRVIEDKNGNYRTYQGKIYKVDDKKEFLIFSLEGKSHTINLAQAIGESFYGAGENYTLVNSYEYYVAEGKPELYVSLQNLNTNSKENRITVYNTETNEETLVAGGMVKLLLHLNLGKVKKEKIYKEDLAMAKSFEVDDDLGLIIEGIDKLPNIRLIVRKGEAYSRLIQMRDRINELSKGELLLDKNMGKIFTGGEIKFGLKSIMDRKINQYYRYAQGMLRNFVWECERPLSDYGEYALFCEYAKDRITNKPIKRYRLYSLRALSNFEHNRFEKYLKPETIERINQLRENNKIIFGENHRFRDEKPKGKKPDFIEE